MTRRKNRRWRVVINRYDRWVRTMRSDRWERRLMRFIFSKRSPRITPNPERHRNQGYRPGVEYDGGPCPNRRHRWAKNKAVCRDCGMTAQQFMAHAGTAPTDA